jgi:hypothetical protein
MSTRIPSLGVKQMGREFDHLTPSTTKVKHEWNSTSSPPICLHGIDRNNLTFHRYFVHSTNSVQDMS